jgi:hypothetical protein
MRPKISFRSVRPMRVLLAGALAFVSSPAWSDSSACDHGTVFLDDNGNGNQDESERGLPNVRVSDGERIVVTDSAGVFRLASTSGRSTFLIKPAGFHAETRLDGLPDTWTNKEYAAAPTLPNGGTPIGPSPCKNFALMRDANAAASTLDVLVFGDPQPKSLVDIDYYRRDIVEPLRDKHHARLGISLGDLVNDDLSLYPALKTVDASLGIPWLHAPGNHDLDFTAGDDAHSLESFRHAFGPDTYAWEESLANFVVLDDVVYQPGKTPAYVGGLREQQFAFLKSYLATAAKDRLLVLSMHIPLFDPTAGVETFRHADRERLFALLAPFPKVLVLSAHSHNQQHFFHGPATGWHGAKPLHEYNVGAACGAFWTGVKDADGIPLATMSDGTPNGYAILSIDPQDFRLRWYVARAPETYQIQLHAPKVLRRGAFPAFGVFANVFMGDADTVVEFRIDDGEWKPMRRVLQPDPSLLGENVRDDEAEKLRGFDRSPEASLSSHLWRGALPTDLSATNHKVEVRATIAGFGLAQASTSYRLEDRAP